MSDTGYFEKDPDATDDFAVNWSDWLYARSDETDTLTWIVPDGITLDHEAVLDGETERLTPGTSVTDGVAQAWLSGGTAGAAYPITSRITTVGGRTDDRTIMVRVVER